MENTMQKQQTPINQQADFDTVRKMGKLMEKAIRKSQPKKKK